MTAVWDCPDLQDSEMLVFLAMADWSDDAGKCWPSIAQIANKSRKSERTVQGVIKSLETKGLLIREEKAGKGCTYFLKPRRECTPAENAPPQPTAQTPAAAAPNTSVTVITQKTTSSSDKRVSKPRFVLPSDIPADEWADFEEMRKKIRKPLTDAMREKALTRIRKLQAQGYDPGEVLSHSTLNSYQGIFPPKDENNGTIQRNGSPVAAKSSDGFTAAIREARARREANDDGGMFGTARMGGGIR